MDLLDENGHFDDREEALSQILSREAMDSTGLEKGIAIPHAKSEGVKSTVPAVGIKPDGVDFQALDCNPSTIFFMILAPQVRLPSMWKSFRRLPRRQHLPRSFSCQEC